MKILIVEDEPELLSEIKFYLEKEDFVCETADTYSYAGDKLALYYYDIVLVDITLPGGSGLDLIKALKKYNRIRA